MLKQVAHLLVSLDVLLLVGCATANLESGDPAQAVITIEDKPNAWNNPYRYIVWNGEDYGPGAFVSVAREKGIKKILLARGDDIQINCATALGKKMDVPVDAGSSVKGGARRLVADDSSSMNSCKIPENIPHPTLGAGEYYVVVANRQISIEGQQPMDFGVFSQHLKDVGATAIVMRNSTIADLLCLSAIAASADVELKQVNLDGSVTGLGVYSQQVTIEKACSQE